MAFVPEGTSAHSQEYLDAGKSDAAHRCTLTAAKILAGTCITLIEQPELLKEVKREFRDKKEAMGKEEL